jgi:hypothetical protein
MILTTASLLPSGSVKRAGGQHQPSALRATEAGWRWFQEQQARGARRKMDYFTGSALTAGGLQSARSLWDGLHNCISDIVNGCPVIGGYFVLEYGLINTDCHIFHKRSGKNLRA